MKHPHEGQVGQPQQPESQAATNNNSTQPDTDKHGLFLQHQPGWVEQNPLPVVPVQQEVAKPAEVVGEPLAKSCEGHYWVRGAMGPVKVMYKPGEISVRDLIILGLAVLVVVALIVIGRAYASTVSDEVDRISSEINRRADA
jgi:hypothetical protein